MSIDLETGLSFAISAVACIWSAVVDVRSRRIPNLVTFTAMAVLLAVHGFFSGTQGLTESGLGLAGGFLVFLVPHLFGLLGAGDVKLLAAVGAGLGSSALLTLVLFTSIAGGLQICLWMVLARQGRALGYRLCYGPAIAAGALATMALSLIGEPYLVLTIPRF